jgi:hypothetical protein
MLQTEGRDPVQYPKCGFKKDKTRDIVQKSIIAFLVYIACAMFTVKLKSP